MDIFIEEFLERELVSVQSAKDFNYEQVEIYKKELEQAERNLNRYKQELVVKQNIQTEILSKQALDRINEAIVAIDITRKSKMEYLKYLSNQLKLRGQNSIKKSPQTPVIENLYSEIEMKIDQMADLMRNYSWKSSEAIKVNKNINILRDEIKLEIVKYYREYFPELVPETLSLIFDNAITIVDLDIAKKKKSVLYQVVESSKYNASKIQANQMTLTKLEEKVKVNRNIYNMFFEQIQGTKIEESIRLANESRRFEIVEPPTEPLEPTNAGIMFNAIVTLLLAFMSGIGCVHLREFLDRSIRTVEEAEESFEIPVIGVIPSLENEPLVDINHAYK